MEERDPQLDAAWLGQVLDALPVAVVVYDVNGRVQLSNRQRIELAGPDVRTLEEAVTRFAPELEDGAPLALEDVPARRALRGETVTGVRIRLRRPDGRVSVMLTNASPLFGPAGEIRGAVLVFNDITQITELERGRRELFTMANHDLRTPLTAILGFVQMARRQVHDTERVASSLEAIERQCTRMVRLIRDLLDVARFESGTIPLEPMPTDVAAMVHIAAERHAESERIVLDVPDTPVRAVVDPDRIDQILDNLLSNALRHTRPGTRVEVSLRVEGAEAVLRVKDQGAGIAPDEQERLFKPFSQLPRGRSFGGTGLGLHISRRIAEAHGGTLVLEETSERGSTFALALPRGSDYS
ncbi:MAG: PAS domain-containing protein [Chloroflexota bacterium]|nr:PAS domain-containing protein [Chloroflexota bacterium]